MPSEIPNGKKYALSIMLFFAYAIFSETPLPNYLDGFVMGQIIIMFIILLGGLIPGLLIIEMFWDLWKKKYSFGELYNSISPYLSKWLTLGLMKNR